MSGRMSGVLIAASLLATAGCQMPRRDAPEAAAAGPEAGAAALAAEQPAIAVWDQPVSPTRQIPARTQVYRELVPVEAIFGEVGLGGIPQSVTDVEIVNRRPSATAPLPLATMPDVAAAGGGTELYSPEATLPTFADYARWLEGSGLRYSIPGEVTAPAAPAPAPAGGATPAPAGGDQAVTITPGQPYTVRKGDSLWVIARRAYGDATQWRKILEANAQQLPDASALRPGTILQIP